MVLYPNKLPESERVCSGICILAKLLYGNVYKYYIYFESIIYILLRMNNLNDEKM